MADYTANVKVLVDQAELDSAEKRIKALDGKTAKVKVDVDGLQGVTGRGSGGRGGGGLGLGTGSLFGQFKRAMDKRQDFLVKAANESNDKLRAHYEKGAKEQGRIAGSSFVKAYKEASAKGSGRDVLRAGGKYLNDAKSKADFKIKDGEIKRQEKLDASVEKHAQNMAKRLSKINSQRIADDNKLQARLDANTAKHAQSMADKMSAARKSDYNDLVKQQKGINALYKERSKYDEGSETYKAYSGIIKGNQDAFDNAFMKYANRYNGMSQKDVSNLVNLESTSKQSLQNAMAISSAKKADAAQAFREKSAYSDIVQQQKHINSLYQKRAGMEKDSASAGVYSDRIAQEEESLSKMTSDYEGLYGKMSDAQKYQLKNLVSQSKLRAADIQMARKANDLNIDGRDIDLARLNYQQKLKQYSQIGKSGKYNDDIASINEKFANAKTNSDVLDANKDVDVLMSKAAFNGDLRMTFFDSFKSKLKGLTELVSPLLLMQLVGNVARGMAQNVTQIDSAMTELRKVTDNSEKEYADYQKSVRDTSFAIGSSQADLIQSSATFARLGYNIKDSAVLGRNAALYASVGDEGMTAEDAATYMVSMMKGFNIAADDSLHVVDALNEVGNNFAISSTGLGESLQRSGAALSVGGNSFEEAIGLTVAANDATQDAKATGTALKTISMRLRGAKVELAEAGEETDGMATSTATLRDTLLQLAGVDILENPTTFKSTYDIMSELADVWDNLSDMSQASIVEKVAGKRGASFFASMMRNWEDAEKATQSALHSEGSAERENENILNSIEGRKKRFKSAFESLSSDVLSSDLLKGGITLGTGLIKGLDTAVNATNTGFGKVISTAVLGAVGLGGKVFVDSFKTLNDGTIPIADALGESFSEAGSSIVDTTKSFGTFLLKHKALASVGLAAAAIGVAYKVWDENTEQLAETHQKLSANLTNYNSAQQQVKTIQEQIASNDEQINTLETSSKTSLAARAKLQQLKQQNSELKTQQKYQESVADNASLAAAYNVRTALNNQSAYQATGDMKSTSSGFAKFGLFFDSLFGNPFEDHFYASEQEHLESVTAKYGDMQKKLDMAYSGDFEEHVFKDQEAAIDYYQGQVSELGQEFSQGMAQNYEYLNALTDMDTGGARKGFEKEYSQVRDSINKAIRERDGNDTLLETMLGYGEYDNIQEKMSQLALSGKLTGDTISKMFPDFSAEAERAGLSVDNIAKTMNSLADGSREASANLALVSDNLETVNSDAQDYEDAFTNITKAAQSGFSATGLSRSDFNVLGKYESAMESTTNGILLNYRKYAELREKSGLSAKANVNSEIKSQQTLLGELQKQQKIYEDRVAKLSKPENMSVAGSREYLESQKSALDNINDSIATTTSNIRNLRAQRAEINGLNSDLAQYINTIGGDYESTANSDTVAKSMSDMINSVNEGRVSSAQAREFAELYSRKAKPTMKNSEVGEAWKDAYKNYKKFFDLEKQKNKNTGEVTYKFTENAKKISDAIKSTQESLGVGWMDEANKSIQMGTSDVNSFAKAMGISTSAATDLINTLNSYGYDVKITDTSKTIGEMAVNAKEASAAMKEYGESGRKAEGIYSNWNRAMTRLRAGDESGNTKNKLSAKKEDMDNYISDVQKARDNAHEKGDGDAAQRLNSVMAEALQYREMMNRGVIEENIMGADSMKFTGEIQTQIQSLQALQAAREEYNATVEGSEKYNMGDLDVEGAEGGLENATAALADYILESGEYADTFGSNMDEIQQAISGMSMEDLANALHLDLSQLQIDGTEDAVAKAQEAGSAMAQAIGESVSNASASLDEVLGAGNYTLSLDAEGNITSVNVNNLGDVEVPAEAEVNSADTSGVGEQKVPVNGELESVDSTGVTADVQVDGQVNIQDQNPKVTYEVVAPEEKKYPDQTPQVNYQLNAPAAPSYPNMDRYITYHITTVGSPPSGGGGMHGTAHADGTAYANGSWGAKGGMALTGELGRELVVYGSRWYTVGDDGAEFTKIPHGAIVFNHKQTEEIFKNGYVTSDGGRGHVAHANGTAYAKGSTDDIDFIEIKLDRLADSISNYSDTMKLYEGYKNRNIMAENAIYTAQKAIAENQSAKSAYLAKANSLGLSGDYVEKIKNGSMDISTIGDEDLKKKIQDYQKWYEKALKVDKTIIDLNKQVKELREQEIKNVTDNYDTFIKWAGSRVDYYKALGEYQTETTGNVDYWNLWAQGYFNSQVYGKYLDEAKQLEKKRDQLFKRKDGSYNQNHALFLEYQTEINKAYEEAYKAQLAVQEVNNKIQELNWDKYNKMLDNLKDIGSELDSVYNLIDDFNSFDEANITDNGITKLGLLTSSIRNSRQEIANYNVALKALFNDYKSGVINIDEYNKRTQEVRQNQLSAAESAQKYRNQIVSLIKDGIEAETDAYSKLIDARRDALDKQKEADDYARKISDKTREINKIEAQIAALSGDDTAATRAKVRSLEAELAELNQDLADERREHEYDVINEAYDDELEKFKEIQDEKVKALTSSLESQNEAISTALEYVKEDYGSVYNELIEFSDEFGINLHNNIIHPWSEGVDAIKEYEAALEVASANVSIGGNNYRTVPKSKSTLWTNADNENKGISSKAKDITPKKKTKKKSTSSGNSIAAGVYRAASNGVLMLSSPNGSAIRRFNKGDAFSADGKVQSGYAHIHIKNASEDKWGWILKSSITKAAHGNQNLPSGVTLFDEKGFGSEVLLTKEGALAQLSAGTKVFNDKQKDVLWQLSKIEPNTISGLRSNVGSIGSISGNVGNTNISLSYDSLLTVNGDVTKDALPKLEEILRMASEKTRADMSKTFRKIGIG